MSQGKIWYVVIDGKANGPHTQQEIQADLNSGKLTFSDLVFKPGLSRWVPVGECKEFERRSIASMADAPAGGDKPPTSKTVANIQIPPETSPSKKDWVVLVKQKAEDGKNHYVQSGPFPGDAVRRKLLKGELQYSDHVWRAGLKNWQVISSIDEFDRRNVIGMDGEESPTVIMTSPTPAAKPKPQTASSSPSDIQSSVRGDAETVVMTKPALAPALSKAEAETVIMTSPTAPDKAAEKEARKAAKAAEQAGKPRFGFKINKKEGVVDIFDEVSDIRPMPKDDDEDVDTIMKPKFFTRKRTAIATVGAFMGMALTYAGLNAYKESVSKPEHRVVASLPPVVPHVPVPAPNAGAGQASAGARAVNPEMEKPLPKKPGVLKVNSLKASSDHPQVVLETDLPGGTTISVEVTAQAGAILKYPSFDLKKEVQVKPGQLPSIDFGGDKLPAGDYKMVARGGDLETSKTFSVGEHDADFQKRLAAFKKKVIDQRKREKSGLQDGVKFISKSYNELTAEYKKTRTGRGQTAKKKWTVMLRTWRKDFERQSGALKNVNEKNRNYFVFPQALLDLKAVEQQLSDVAQLYDKSLKTGRSIASESDMNEVFAEHLDKLKETVKGLK